METEAKLRRLHHIEKMTIKALARQTGMSRNTIRRVLRADKAGHFYQRKIQPMPALRQIQHHKVMLHRKQSVSGLSTMTPEQRDLFEAVGLPKPRKERL